MSRWILGIGAILCAALLWGCGTDVPVTEPTTEPARPTVEQTVPSVTEPETTAPETVPAITEPPLPQEPPMLEPVTLLQSTKWVTFPQLLSLGQGKVAASRSYYDRTTERYVNLLEILDVYEDKVLGSVLHEGTRELVLQRFGDGAIVTADPKTMEYSVYDGTLTLQRRFSAPCVDGWFSYDRKSLYYLDSGVLYRMDVDTGNRGRVKLAQELRFQKLVGIHPTEDLLVAQVDLSAYTDHFGLAVVDMVDGSLRLLTDRLRHVWLTGDSFYGIAMNDEAYGNDVYHGTLSGGPVTRIPASQIGDDQMGWSVLPGSHLLVRRFAPDEGTRSTAILDLISGGWVDLERYAFQDCAFGTVWLTDERLILGFYEVGDYFHPVVFDPKAMSFGPGPEAQVVQWPELVDGTVLERYLATVEGPELGTQLQELRQQADALEQTYHITIRLGEQVELACRYAGRGSELMTEPDTIRTALQMLEQELEKYPEGFFDAFRNGVGEGGLCVSLTGKIRGELEPVGFCALIRDRIEMGLDVTAPSLPQTIHHEIWHAVEIWLSTDVFDTPQWAACNPVGYQYYGGYDKGYQALVKWTWSHGGTDLIHFVDPYARIDGREDRAKIWEMVMTIDAQGLMSAEPVRQKLRIMVDAMTDRFPGGGPWDGYL